MIKLIGCARRPIGMPEIHRRILVTYAMCAMRQAEGVSTGKLGAPLYNPLSPGVLVSADLYMRYNPKYAPNAYRLIGTALIGNAAVM